MRLPCLCTRSFVYQALIFLSPVANSFSTHPMNENAALYLVLLLICYLFLNSTFGFTLFAVAVMTL